MSDLVRWLGLPFGFLIVLSCSEQGLGVAGADELALSKLERKISEILWRDYWKPEMCCTDRRIRDPAVVELYPRSEEIAEVARALLTSDAELAAKELAVLLLQCLPIDQYLDLVRFATEKLEAGAIESRVVEVVISPGPEWGTRLYLAYAEPDVRDALERLYDSKFAGPGVRSRIEGVLSGAYAAFVRAYDLPEEPLPRLSCE